MIRLLVQEMELLGRTIFVGCYRDVLSVKKVCPGAAIWAEELIVALVE